MKVTAKLVGLYCALVAVMANRTSASHPLHRFLEKYPYQKLKNKNPVYFTRSSFSRISATIENAFRNQHRLLNSL